MTPGTGEHVARHKLSLTAKARVRTTQLLNFGRQHSVSFTFVSAQTLLCINRPLELTATFSPFDFKYVRVFFAL